MQFRESPLWMRRRVVTCTYYISSGVCGLADKTLEPRADCAPRRVKEILKIARSFRGHSARSRGPPRAPRFSPYRAMRLARCFPGHLIVKPSRRCRARGYARRPDAHPSRMTSAAAAPIEYSRAATN